MTELRLDGRVALVTGAGSTIGLGRAMALALARAGARVAMTDIAADALDQSAAAVQEINGPGSVLPLVADATRPEDAERVVQQTIQQLGGLHILVNNAGINPRYSFWDLPVEDWLRTIATNLTAPFLLTRAAAPHLRQQGWGRIISITTSLDTMLATVPYGPSKAGHEAFIAVLARELAGTGVTANVLIPGGAVDTHMTRDFGRSAALQPEIMQAPVVWLASEESANFHGRRLVAQDWDESLPLDERLALATAPVGWPQLGRTTHLSSAPL